MNDFRTGVLVTLGVLAAIAVVGLIVKAAGHVG